MPVSRKFILKEIYMEDYFGDGYDRGYGNYSDNNHNCPTSDGERYDYERGMEYGEYRRRLSDELNNEY